MLVVKCVLLLFCYHQLLGGAVSEFTPTVYPAKISSQCGQYDLFNDEQLLESLQQVKQRIPSQAYSCKCIHNADTSSSSGYYNIVVANGSVVQVYCDMEGTNCGGEGGWTRVAYVNMTQVGATCPVGLNRSFNSKSYCGNTGLSGCIGTMFPTLVEYSRVCGQVRGYQYAATGAFHSYNANTSLTIDDNYVDGVSITYGSAPRKHLWTYAAGLQDIFSYYKIFDCPCKQSSNYSTPPFIGTDHYCESGFYNCCPLLGSPPSSDTLWDGQQCDGLEAPCCTHPNMPWFIKTLNETATEDIEMRLCKHVTDALSFPEIFGYSDTPLDLIEIFVR